VPGTVPYWQLGLSMALLVAGFIGTTWIAAKIYRTGILLYGKKVTLKEVGKWLVRKS
jgi:ABC-2 type transport system permease protein